MVQKKLLYSKEQCKADPTLEGQIDPKKAFEVADIIIGELKDGTYYHRKPLHKERYCTSKSKAYGKGKVRQLYVPTLYDHILHHMLMIRRLYPMLKDVLHSDYPARVIYESRDGLAHLTFADNIRETEDPEGNPAWLADLYMMTAQDSEGIAQRCEAAYDRWLAFAKAQDEENWRKQQKQEAETHRLDDVEDAVAEIMEVILGG